MREYGQIQCGYWRDQDIRTAGDDARILGAYLLTGPHSNGIGCYYLPDGYLTTDLGWSSERVSEALGKLSQIGFVKRCTTTDFVLVPKFLYWNEIANGNVAKAREKEFDAVPRRASFHGDLCECLKRFGKHWRKEFQTVLDDGRNQEPNRTEPIQKGTNPVGGAPSAPPEVGEGVKKKVHGTPDDDALARWMFGLVREVAPSAKDPNWPGWANAVRLMREQDGRTHDEIRALFAWANADRVPRGGDFCWSAVILSPANLREKWTQLEAKRAASAGGNGARGAAPVDPRWWKSDEGVVSKAKELAIERRQQEASLVFKARVCHAAGPGEWDDERDVTLHRLIEEFREGKRT